MAYTTLPLLRDYLGIPAGNTTEDVPLQAAIDAADEWIDGYTGRTFAVDTPTARQFVAADPTVVQTDRFANAGTITVQIDTAGDGVYDTTLTVTDDYVLLPLNGTVYDAVRRVDGSAWPRYTTGRPGVQVTARWADTATTVPNAVEQAALILAARLYQRKASPLGIMTGFADYGIARISRTDPDVAALLASYRTVGTA